VNPEIVLEQIVVPEIPIVEVVIPETMRPQIATGGELRRRHGISSPYVFPVGFQADVNKAAGVCPLCGHVKEEDSFDEEETLIEESFEPSFFRFFKGY
jgi:hypothetical protein